ncbi:hypothetical protein B0H10DRAFT_1688878, partial [Mycena sp. CBHHK59/15]
NTSLIFKKCLQIQGLLVGELMGTLGPQFFMEVPMLMVQGKITAKESCTKGL